jgi:hypothetical protein
MVRVQLWIKSKLIVTSLRTGNRLPVTMLFLKGWSMSKRVYMVIENFKNGDAVPVYRRFRERGRMAPAGLSYVSSWVNDKLDRCYQLMETEDRGLLDQWMANWSDLVDFEVHPVITSNQAAEKIAPRL